MIDSISGAAISKNGACGACRARTWVREIEGKKGGEVCNRSKIRSLPTMCPLLNSQKVGLRSRLLADLGHTLRSTRER